MCLSLQMDFSAGSCMIYGSYGNAQDERVLIVAGETPSALDLADRVHGFVAELRAAVDGRSEA
jgi:hypothetical protein